VLAGAAVSSEALGSSASMVVGRIHFHEAIEFILALFLNTDKRERFQSQNLFQRHHLIISGSPGINFPSTKGPKSSMPISFHPVI
jgi:hypothetical protein